MATVKELEAALEEAQMAEREAERESRKAQSAEWSRLAANPDNWEWQVNETQYAEFFSDCPKVPALGVYKRMKPEVLAAWRANGPGVFSSDMETEERWFGMTYYRTDENILTHGGGGHLVLNDPKLCSDEEWAAIKSGNIPKKFVR